MKELTCPNCGTVIKVDDAAYAEILAQVKDDVVREEVERRLAAERKVQEAAAAAKAAKEAEKAVREETRRQEELASKDQEIELLKQKLEGIEEKKGLELKAMEEKLAGWEKNRQMEIETIRLQAKDAAAEEVREKEAEIIKKGEEINRLIAEASKDKELAAERMRDLIDTHQKKVETLEKEVEMYKNFKTKRSVKLLGEDLEQHCYTLYNQMLLPVMPESTFEKDNDAVKEDGEEKGTKGDFIFRGKEHGTEFVSIMFEMKNESEVSANRKKNADHFEKLDKDRRKKGCEYAVLVSMLEMDNDLYNSGITVVPGYEKMYVVRPDNFIPIITLLVQTSKKSLEARQELEIARRQSKDVTGFEDSLNAFKDDFTKYLGYAKDRYDEAVDGIDAAIKKLQAIKDALRISSGHLITAGNKLDGLTVKKLTKDNPTMQQAFDEARRKKALAEAEAGPEDQ